MSQRFFHLFLLPETKERICLLKSCNSGELVQSILSIHFSQHYIEEHLPTSNNICYISCKCSFMYVVMSTENNINFFSPQKLERIFFLLPPNFHEAQNCMMDDEILLFSMFFSVEGSFSSHKS